MVVSESEHRAGGYAMIITVETLWKAGEGNNPEPETKVKLVKIIKNRLMDKTLFDGTLQELAEQLGE